MKKTVVCSILTLLLLLPLCTSAQAAKLSCGTQALANEPLLVKGGIYGEDVKFTDADFRQALGVTTYPDITIQSLPDMQEGTLKVDGLRISKGQVVRRTQIDRLTFTPATHMVKEASFTFTCGTLCGGATLTCSIRFTDKVNEAPTATDVAKRCLTSKKNVSVYGTLCGYDPEGDDLTYLIVTYPKKGVLKVVNQETGDFSYTPQKNYKGTDTFSYVVRDSYGNYSPIATVTLDVKGVETDIDLDAPTYSLVTREDFLVALLKTYGYFPTHHVETFFDDNEEISPPHKAYVMEGVKLGVVTGDLACGELLFRPKDLITREEATRMILALDGEASVPTGSFSHLTKYLTYSEVKEMLSHF